MLATTSSDAGGQKYCRLNCSPATAQKHGRKAQPDANFNPQISGHKCGLSAAQEVLTNITKCDMIPWLPKLFPANYELKWGVQGQQNAALWDQHCGNAPRQAQPLLLRLPQAKNAREHLSASACSRYAQPSVVKLHAQRRPPGRWSKPSAELDSKPRQPDASWCFS